MGFLPEVLEGAQPCGHLDVSPVKLISDVRSPKLSHNTLALFQAVKLVVIGYNSDRKLRDPASHLDTAVVRALENARSLGYPLLKPATVFLSFLEKKKNKTKLPQNSCLTGCVALYHLTLAVFFDSVFLKLLRKWRISNTSKRRPE